MFFLYSLNQIIIEVLYIDTVVGAWEYSRRKEDEILYGDYILSGKRVKW